MKRAILLFIFAVAVLSGCGAAPSYDTSMASESARVAPAASEASADAGAVALIQSDDSSTFEVAASEEAMVDQSVSATSDDGTQIGTANLLNRRVIRHADLSIEVGDVTAALNGATALSTRFGGYVLSTQTWQAGEQPAARLSFAVPVERFEAALEAARALGDVQRETVDSQDVTAEFVDLEARLTNLEATAARIRGFLDDAKNVEEALAVNNELSRIEEQIEQIKGRLNALTQQTAFSTIDIELLPLPPVADPSETLRTTARWTPLRTVDDALTVLIEVAQVGLNALIWLLMVGVPLALVVGFCFWLARRLWRSRSRTAASTQP